MQSEPVTEAAGAFLAAIIESAVEKAVKAALAVEREHERVEPFLNVEQAATFLATTEDSIRGLVKRGQIPCHRTEQRRVLFLASELATYVKGA